jgi:hypothetical protein
MISINEDKAPHIGKVDDALYSIAGKQVCPEMSDAGLS